MTVDQVIALAKNNEWPRVVEVLTTKVNHIKLNHFDYDELIPFWIENEFHMFGGTPAEEIAARYEITEESAQKILNILAPYDELRNM